MQKSAIITFDVCLSVAIASKRMLGFELLNAHGIALPTATRTGRPEPVSEEGRLSKNVCVVVWMNLAQRWIDFINDFWPGGLVMLIRN